MATQDSIEATVLAELAAAEDTMFDLLARLVNTDSHTRDKAGVDAVGAILTDFLGVAGIAVETIPNAEFGDALRAVVPAPDGRTERPVLIMGHRDTVFAAGEAERRPFRVENGRAFGPGVCDMKGGLVINAAVLVTMARLNAARAPLVGLFTADEEIASPSSRGLIEREAGAASVVFNSEPGRPTGNVVVARKGGVFMRFDVEGKAAHSGSSFADGASAIEAAARKIQALHALTDLDRAITVNVGRVGGGHTVNTIAPDAFGEIDLRYLDTPDRERMLDRINRIVDEIDVPGTSASLAITGEFEPLRQTEASRQIYEIYEAAARDVGLKVGPETSGGCSDAGLASSAGAPTLCGTGPVGGGSHTQREYIELDTLVPRAQAMALTILRLFP